ncbi:hypothetical protein KM043_012265 [Ampulex compressa]|nr:hypothetical protein KM043_012265 [Ampulex compressa]
MWEKERVEIEEVVETIPTLNAKFPLVPIVVAWNMGKQKRQRRKPHKNNPTCLPSVRDVEEAEDVIDEDREKALQKVYEDVQSPNVEEKLSGLQTLESMCCDSAMAIRIAENGITKMIGPLLVDRNVVVRAATASALRYIAENGKEEAYTHLVRDDVITPLSALLNGHYNDWRPIQEKSKNGGIDDQKETLIQAVTLLWTLCERNERAVSCANKEGLVNVLTKFFDVATYGIDVSTVAAQCALSLTEDNPVAIKELAKHEETLVNLLNLKANDSTDISDVISLKVAIAGLIMNTIGCSENNPMPVNNFSSTAKKKVRGVKKILGAQQQALEMLANLCSDDQESNDSLDLDSDADCEPECAEDISMDDKSYKLMLALPVELVEVIDSCDLIKKTWNMTVPVGDDSKDILEQSVEGKSVLKQFHTLRCRAYLCLNNLMSSLETDSLGGVESLYKMWLEIGAVVFKEVNPNDIELLESATAAMRASLQKLSESKANIFDRLTIEDIQPILNGERQCPNANVRANLIRILGNLALILIGNNELESEELTRHISSFLLDTCTMESEVWVTAEALDAIMDMYAEDETDKLAHEIQLVEKLKNLVPIFKHKVRQQKKYLGDKSLVVSTVNANIMRFMKYKGHRLKSTTLYGNYARIIYRVKTKHAFLPESRAQSGKLDHRTFSSCPFFLHVYASSS